MKNQSMPLQEIRVVHTLRMFPEYDTKAANSFNELKVLFEPSEFTDHAGWLGLLDERVEPERFLTPSQLKEKSGRKVQNSSQEVEPDDLPEALIKLMMSDKRHFYERSRYTFFTLLSDFGGFKEAVMLLPVQIMSFYASKMLSKSIAH